LQNGTSNIQLSTSNIERTDTFGGFNFQHKTVNRKWQMEQLKYDSENRLLEYSSMIINIVEKLPNSRVGNHVAGQLIRSGTSPYANHGEAQATESSPDT
jgi:hypothetical protein